MESGGVVTIKSLIRAGPRLAHPLVAEAAVVAAAATGQAVVASVILRQVRSASEGAVEELRQQVAREIGPIARPRRFVGVPELPKAR